MEIDFLITEGKRIVPIEVKSGNYRSHASLDKFRSKFASKIGNAYILYTKDVMEKDGIHSSAGILAMFYKRNKLFTARTGLRPDGRTG